MTTNNETRFTREREPAETQNERNKAEPEGRDLTRAKEVWKDGETTPSHPGGGKEPAGRVADAGDIGRGNISPYGLETQAEQVGGQTRDTGKGDHKN